MCPITQVCHAHIVSIVPTDKLEAAEDFVHIQHYICDNHILVSHADTDNDALVQVLTMLGMVSPHCIDLYIHSLLIKLKSKCSEWIIALLKDRDMLNIAVTLYKWHT